jgi:hypothetical protein
VWGSLTALQRGQVLREGASRRQLEARRIRVFDFDIFLLGTATVVSLVSGKCPVGGFVMIAPQRQKLTGRRQEIRP